jgi:hypothetical protein
MTNYAPNRHFNPNIAGIGEEDEMPKFGLIACEIQNWTTHWFGLVSTEAWLFRKYFGMSKRVIEILWEMLVRNSLLPEDGLPKHLLWALYFLKVYPKQGPGCVVVGTSNGAVDLKTHRKWVWASSRPSWRLRWWC